MNFTEADHVWFVERIEAYIAGGLAGEELARFQAHAAACLPCEGKLADGVRSDLAFQALLAAHRPAPGLENRTITALRTRLDAHRRLVMHPNVRRAASVAAAALLLATMGYAGKLILDGGSLSRFNPGKIFAKSPAQLIAQIGHPSPGAAQSAGRKGVPLLSTPPRAEHALFNGRSDDNEAMVRAQLDRRLPEINFSGNTLTDVVDFLRDVSGASIDVNWKQLENAGINKETPINLKLRDVRFTTALNETLAAAAGGKTTLGYTIGGGTIHVSTSDGNRAIVAQSKGVKSLDGGSIGSGTISQPPIQLTQVHTQTPQEVADARAQNNPVIGLIDTAQKQIRDGNYQVALGTIDTVLARDPNNDYAKSVRPLVQDKMQLAQKNRSWNAQFDENMEKSLTAAEEKRIPYDDIMRYPANWPDISEVRDATVRQEREIFHGRVQQPDLVLTDVSKSVSVPDGGTLLLGGQTLDGDRDKAVDGPVTAGPTAAASTGGKFGLGTNPQIIIQKESEQKELPMLSTKGGDEYKQVEGRPVASGGDVALRGVKVDPGIQSISINGGGMLVLKGENDYAGATVVNGGTVKAADSLKVSNGTGDVAGTATLHYFSKKGEVSEKAGLTAFYGYQDSIVAPKPGEAQHQKLAEVATVDGKVAHTYEVHDLITHTPDFRNPPDLNLSGTDTNKTDNTQLAPMGIPGGGAVVKAQPETLEKSLELKRTGSLGLRGDTAENAGNPVKFKTENLPFYGINQDNIYTNALAVADSQKLGEAKKPEPSTPSISGEKPPVVPAAVTTGVTPPVEVAKPLAVETPTTTTPAVTPTQLPPVVRKIIRNGEVIFEVDSFDSSLMQIGKIVIEEAGYVSTTDSEKLPNGKVKGTITVRIPPERLDVFVLKLRGLGDLKNQRIAAQDVTKQYVDLESALRADRAMEKRLLDLIEKGKGDVKDLVAAEKELGNYREKIEQIEGELRFLSSQVAMSTLNITLFERDIKTPTAAFETEIVDTAIETEDVEKARLDALKAVDDAKGRVIESQMKRFEAGQLQATIVAEVAPENAGSVIDRLKQLGRVSRMDVDRKQTTTGGQGAPVGLKMERKATVFKVSLYNLANIAPRETVNVSVACEDVEKAYKAILAAAEVQENQNGVAVQVGRVVSSSLNSQRADQVTGTISIEVRSDKAAAVEAAIRAAGGPSGEVMHLTVTENPDAANVTRSKRGYSVSLASLASVAPRETAIISVASKNVTELHQKLMTRLQDAKLRGRVYTSRLGEQNGQNIDAFVDFEVPRGEVPGIEALLSGEGGDVVSRNSTRSNDTQNTLDSKLRIQVTILNVDRIPARETAVIAVAAKDVPALYQTLMAQLQDGKAHGHVFASRLDEQDRLNVEAFVDFEIPRGEAANIEALINGGAASEVFRRNVTRSTDVANTLDTKLRLQVSVINVGRLRPREEGTFSIEVSDPEKTLLEVQAIAATAGGRTFEPHLNKDETGKVEGKVAFDVPLTAASSTADKLRGLGVVRESRSLTNESVPAGNLAKARFEVTLVNATRIIAANRGIGSRIREGLSTSVDALLLVLEWLIVAAPFVLVVWILWKLFRRGRKEKPAVVSVPAAG